MPNLLLFGAKKRWASSISPQLTAFGTNLDFEAGDPPTGWSAQNSAVLASVADPRTGSAGTKCISVTNGAVNYGFAKQATTLPANTLVLSIAWIKSLAGLNPFRPGYVRITGATNFIDNTWGYDTWEKKFDVGRSEGVNPYIGLWASANAAGQEWRFDDLEFYTMTLASCLQTRRRTPTGDFIVSQRLRVTPTSWIGFCLNMDSANPLNCVFAFVDGVNIYLDTCLNGVYTRYTTACTWANDDELKVTKTGTTYKLYKNNTQVGTDQTINQAAINDNTLHMQFSTYGSNLFTSPFVL